MCNCSLKLSHCICLIGKRNSFLPYFWAGEVCRFVSGRHLLHWERKWGEGNQQLWRIFFHGKALASPSHTRPKSLVLHTWESGALAPLGYCSTILQCLQPTPAAMSSLGKWPQEEGMPANKWIILERDSAFPWMLVKSGYDLCLLCKCVTFSLSF